HRDFDGTLPQCLAGTVDRCVSSPDNRDPRAQLNLRGAHADVSKERQSVEYSLLVLAFGAHAVGLGKTDRQNTGVVVPFQIVPADIFANFTVRFERDAKFNQSLNLTIEDVLRKHPVRNPAAIQPAGFGRFFKNGDLVTEARKLVRGTVPSGTRSDDSDLLAIGRAGFDYVVFEGLSQITEKALDRPNRNCLVVLAAVARLFTRVIAHASRHRRKWHVLLDEGVGIQILAALHKVEIALNFFVGSTCVVAGWQLVPVHGADRAPVAGRKQVLPFVLRGAGSDACKRDFQPVRNTCAFSRHEILSYTATGFNGMMRNSSSAISNAFLLTIMG